MEKIKAAIQKANASREQNPEQKSTTINTPLAERKQIDDNDTVDKITYQQTKTITLDPNHLEKYRIIAHNKTDQRAINFDMLRTRVLHTMKENDWRTLAITSPTGSCGKTVMSINLSLSIAKQTERTVLLADFDLRKPRVGAYLGLPESSNLVDYLEGKKELGETLVNPGIPRFTVLANSISINNATETLSTNKMKNFVAELRERYESRTIIFDLPPLLETDDAMAFIPQVDCVLVVIANGATTSSEIEKVKRLLHDKNVVGIVLNKSDDANNTKYYY